MTPSEFVEKWHQVSVTERSAAQTHFNELCDLLGVDKPFDVDPAGEFYAFERHVSKVVGGKGFADVWKRGHFAWEYKGKRKNLHNAYLQLLLYRDDLDNPPLLIVSDIERIEIHTNFTGTTKKVHSLRLDDLLVTENLDLLRKVFTNPQLLNPKEHRERITEQATAKIGEIALRLRDRGHGSEEVAHFVMQLVFCLFAEDAGLLPNRLITKILRRTGDNPERAKQYLTMLFDAMAQGGEVLLEDVAHFNGGLFEGGGALALTSDEIRILHEAATLDWAEVEPAIFGTLFERSLDPNKRSQLGAHYTSRDDILRIVEPVVMQPLRREWISVREEVERRLQRGHHKVAKESVSTFLNKLHLLRVLDPACGSGNFLYVAMQQLKDLEKEVVTLAQSIGAPGFALIGPKQFYGLEINIFAQELTSMVVWIGYLQWNRANDVSNQQEPILERLDNIRLHDALMNKDGSEYEWPEVDFIIGNPPFIGDKRMRAELGDFYVEQLRKLFKDRLPGQADFVTYWFEKSRAQIERDKTKRAGLIATNSIRGGANREVLQRIKTSGDMFMAWADEPWVLEGAAVRVSIVGFDDGSEGLKVLNGSETKNIQPDLSSGLDLSAAKALKRNLGKGFNGVMPSGPFGVSEEVAHSWLGITNPNGVRNDEVLKPYISGQDIVGRDSKRWIVDFGLMTLDKAREYIVPFAHVEQNVKPVRAENRRKATRERWWRFGEARPAMRAALDPLSRFIATPEVSKHRIFVWLTKAVLPAHKVVVIAADDDLTFGLVNSSIHAYWAKATGSWHGVGNDLRYTYSTTFATFPFPYPPEEQRCEIVKWAKYVDDVRSQLLWQDHKLTLTKLYNELDELRETCDSTHRAFPLFNAHERLDEAVVAGYGWEWPLDEEEVLRRLLELNLARAVEESSVEAEVVN